MSQVFEPEPVEEQHGFFKQYVKIAGRKARCALCHGKILIDAPYSINNGLICHDACIEETKNLDNNVRRRTLKLMGIGAAFAGATAIGASRLASASGVQQTQITANGVILPSLTSDPANPEPGQMWYRSDAGVTAHFDVIENRVIYSNRIINGSAVVTAKGIANGLSVLPNDGQDWGPDTMLGATAPGQYGPSYTTSVGIQEALKSLPHAVNPITGNLVPSGIVKLISPYYNGTSPIVVYDDWFVTIEGISQPAMIGGIPTISQIKAAGGSIIDMESSSGCFTCMLNSTGNTGYGALFLKNLVFATTTQITSPLISGKSAVFNVTCYNAGKTAQGSLSVLYLDFVIAYDMSDTNTQTRSNGTIDIETNGGDTLIGGSFVYAAGNAIGTSTVTIKANNVSFDYVFIFNQYECANPGSTGGIAISALTLQTGGIGAIGSLHIQGSVTSWLTTSPIGSTNFMATINRFYAELSEPTVAIPSGQGRAYINQSLTVYSYVAGSTWNPLIGNTTYPADILVGNGSIFRLNIKNFLLGQFPSPVVTNPPVSGTVYQNTNLYDIEIDLPVYATTSGTAGYVTIAKGATSTPTAIGNQYVNGATSSTSTDIIKLRVPAGWYYFFTSSGVTFGTASVFAD